MTYTQAIMRQVGDNFAQGITTVNLDADLNWPNYELAVRQHQAYADLLLALGLEVKMLDRLSDYPDAHFVEDAAIVTPEIGVITRPGAEARLGEEQHMIHVLTEYRTLASIEAPGTLDGGDILLFDKTCFIGLSERTNEEGATQLSQILTPYGYRCTTIPVGAGLHLKSSINYIGHGSLLVTEDFSNLSILADFKKIVVDKDEEYAANTLWVNDHLITPKGFPKTKAKLETTSLKVIELDVSEMQKMDGGLTCLSLRF